MRFTSRGHQKGKVAQEVATHSLVGLRAGTLNLRTSRWEKFRFWLVHVKGRSAPSTINEVANALFTLERLMLGGHEQQHFFKRNREK